MSINRTSLRRNLVAWLSININRAARSIVRLYTARHVHAKSATAIILLVCTASAILLSSCGEQSTEDLMEFRTVRAERFEITDSNGNVRAFIGTLDDGRPTLTLMDESANARAWMYLSEDGSPRLFLIDEPLLVLVDGAGEFRSVLRLRDDGSPILTLNDESGVPIWSAIESTLP